MHLLAFVEIRLFNVFFKILPEMCEAGGFKCKTAHSLRITCVSSLFNGGVEEKLIRERSGYRSNALFSTKSLRDKMCLKFQRS